MLTAYHVDILFQVIVFLFAISVHESAHAWTAFRRGDPTAFMLGRVTLNPVKHIDLFGTVILPLLAVLTHFPMIGWAKPTPVNTRNFKHLVRDDIMTSVAGPVSNLLLATAAVLIMLVIQVTSAVGRVAVMNAIAFTYTRDMPLPTESILNPICLLLYRAMQINVLLAVFNLIPVPPLDGSHVVRHFLSDTVRRAYDSIGIFGLFLLMFFGGGVLWSLMSPVVGFFNSLLMRM
jgi:Zn-dependent protease